MRKVRIALDCKGDEVYDRGREEEAYEYYELRDKFRVKKLLED